MPSNSQFSQTLIAALYMQEIFFHCLFLNSLLSLLCQAKGNTEKLKRKVVQQLGEDLSSKKVINQGRKIYLKFPSEDSHSGHAMGEVSRFLLLENSFFTKNCRIKKFASEIQPTHPPPPPQKKTYVKFIIFALNFYSKEYIFSILVDFLVLQLAYASMYF